MNWGGLAGFQGAWQIARRGIPAVLTLAQSSFFHRSIGMMSGTSPFFLVQPSTDHCLPLTFSRTTAVV